MNAFFRGVSAESPERSGRCYQSLPKLVHRFDRRSMDFFFSASAFYPILSDTGRNAETDPGGVSAGLSAVS
jgi:hypothetical protein